MWFWDFSIFLVHLFDHDSVTSAKGVEFDAKFIYKITGNCESVRVWTKLRLNFRWVCLIISNLFPSLCLTIKNVSECVFDHQKRFRVRNLEAKETKNVSECDIGKQKCFRVYHFTSISNGQNSPIRILTLEPFDFRHFSKPHRPFSEFHLCSVSDRIQIHIYIYIYKYKYKYLL